MKEIQLTQGKVALVDDEDFEYLNQWKWYASKNGNNYYALRTMWCKIDYGKYKWNQIHMHREIMHPINGMYVDHINHDGLDNRKCNLRNVTHRENMLNMKKMSNAGYRGVYKDKKKFRARIYKNGKTIHLGSFNTAEEAYQVYLTELRNL